MSFTRFLARSTGEAIGKLVNYMAEEEHKPREHVPITKDRMVSTLFGAMGYNLLSEAGKDKYWADYVERTHPLPKELSEGQKLMQNPEEYLSQFLSKYMEGLKYEQQQEQE